MGIVNNNFYHVQVPINGAVNIMKLEDWSGAMLNEAIPVAIYLDYLGAECASVYFPACLKFDVVAREDIGATHPRKIAETMTMIEQCPYTETAKHPNSEALPAPALALTNRNEYLLSHGFCAEDIIAMNHARELYLQTGTFHDEVLSSQIAGEEVHYSMLEWAYHGQDNYWSEPSDHIDLIPSI